MKKFEEIIDKETIDAQIEMSDELQSCNEHFGIDNKAFLVRSIGGNLLYIEGSTIVQVRSEFWKESTIGYCIYATDKFGKEWLLKSHLYGWNEFDEEYGEGYSSKISKEEFKKIWNDKKIKLYEEMELEMYVITGFKPSTITFGEENELQNS